jgi:hypothetical protein
VNEPIRRDRAAFTDDHVSPRFRENFHAVAHKRARTKPHRFQFRQAFLSFLLPPQRVFRSVFRRIVRP